MSPRTKAKAEGNVYERRCKARAAAIAQTVEAWLADGKRLETALDQWIIVLRYINDVRGAHKKGKLGPKEKGLAFSVAMLIEQMVVLVETQGQGQAAQMDGGEG